MFVKTISYKNKGWNRVFSEIIDLETALLSKPTHRELDFEYLLSKLLVGKSYTWTSKGIYPLIENQMCLVTTCIIRIS